ncbi:MAG TPA: TIGR03986 family CRISPR-associated RAMP protein [Desulfobulbaceae bacterium]|nr:TIGR03986 family CRISPR-associated RAMP protein [Desulfobulbaceae bacterium]
MEKATLQVKKTKKGKLDVRLRFENGRSMPFPRKPLQNLDLDNTPVLVQREKGQPVRITRENGEVLFDSQPPVSSGQGGSPERKRNQAMLFDHIRQVKNPASAPYNFVPLNKTVVTVPGSCPRENKYFTENNRHTGWIDLRIEALTPLYIRGTLTKEEVQQGKRSNEKPDFFSPAGICRIPGSSLRGMVRTLVEIVSYGRLHFVDTDQRLYYRALADKSNLRHEYGSCICSSDRTNTKTQYKCMAGVLVKDRRVTAGERFYIRSSGENFHQVPKHEARKKYKEEKKTYQEFTYIKLKQEGGYLVVSGDMPGKKKRDWFVRNPAENAREIRLSRQDVQDYLDDSNRDNDVPNLIQKAREEKEGVPCFYTLWQDSERKQRVSFGHTAMFRLAYKKIIGEHIPRWLQEQKPEEIPIPDFAGEIFGNTSSHAGRVFFEDAVLQHECARQQMAVKTPHILSTPKPTTFQHYLVQTSEDASKLQHYNSSSAIRGHKMYWHKSGEHWEQKDQQEIKQHPSQYTKIRPVKTGSQFNGRIRFENLSSEELGALLFVLDLPEGCAHKLGMGKPLGLGSVCIAAHLHLSGRKKRYKDLFAEWEKTKSSYKDKECYKQKFTEHLVQKIKEGNELWRTVRMRELSTILNFQLGKQLEKRGETRYMTIAAKEFKKRKVLPPASDYSPTG